MGVQEDNKFLSQVSKITWLYFNVFMIKNTNK